MSHEMDMVYQENLHLNELTNALSQVQDNMSDYLNAKTSDSLEDYYRSEQVYSQMIQEHFEEDIENYKTILGINQNYAYMIAVVCGDEQVENYMTNAVGSSIRMQKHYQEVRECLKEYFQCIVGTVMANKLAVLVPFEKDQIMAMTQACQLKDWFVEKIMTACRNILNKRAEKSGTIISMAKNYIQSNYNRDIPIPTTSADPLRKMWALLLRSIRKVELNYAGGKEGVAMPTRDLQGWNQDGSNMEAQLIEAGYEVDIQYASNDIPTQVSQIENMINSGCELLVIASIDGDSLGTVLEQAKEKNIPVIADDRLIMNSDAVTYYATFDNYMVGTRQGKYIKEQLDLDNAAGPFNIELVTGDPGDSNARYFFGGAMDVLQPYIDEGKLVVKSGQTNFETVATANWSTETSQSRMDAIISANYAECSERYLSLWRIRRRHYI